MRKIKLVLAAAVTMLPTLVLTLVLSALVALYAFWWHRATPDWRQGALTAAELQRPALQVAETSLRNATLLGLMELPTLAHNVRYDTLTEVRWSNGDVMVILSVGPPTLLDNKDLPYLHPRMRVPPSKPSVQVAVPGNFTLLALSRQNEKYALVKLIRWPHGATLIHKPGIWVEGVAMFAIGEMNKDSLRIRPIEPGTKSDDKKETVVDGTPIPNPF